MSPDILTALEHLGKVMEQHITYKITLQRQAEKLYKIESELTELKKKKVMK